VTAPNGSSSGADCTVKGVAPRSSAGRSRAAPSVTSAIKYLLFAAVALLGFATSSARACTGQLAICDRAQSSSFALIRSGQPAAILVDPADDAAVHHAAQAFAADLQRVGGRAAVQLRSPGGVKGPVIIIGTLGHSPIIDRLVAAGAITAGDIAGKWEAYRQIVVDRPFPGVARALVIVGSDRRGTVFGTYDISERMGVSPWHWFADVPVRRRPELYLTAGSRVDWPKVRYRGFFINDEDPAFNGWAKTHFGGINSQMYAHVFDLLLRLKGNYLWPAMWAPKAFNDDDPRNKVLADELGVVMGTSHHEPMTRAQDEWHRHTERGVTGGKWDYATNAANLRTFWRGGIERMMSKPGGGRYESLVTVGMRGDGDEAMAEGTATELLERIVADQRAIIADVTREPAERTPQVWALYKEVQDYYDHGMRVPDDVILLFSDDNWGQIRRLPAVGDTRRGGSGIYYHFDYVGGPRNYKWLNTNQIEKTWQQMDLAYARGARALWIVNVGDIKPMEYPLSFFMRQAWDPEAMTPAALARFPEEWARATFGPARSHAIADLLTQYSKLAARRKPELITPESFPLGDVDRPVPDGGEFGAMVAEWHRLHRDAQTVQKAIPPVGREAFYQLVEHPISAMSNLYDLYYAVALNRRLAAANDPRANAYAEAAERAFRRDARITADYDARNAGKWSGMMAQTHIGYTSWQQPPVQVMPAVSRVSAGAPKPAPQRPAEHGNGEIFTFEAREFTHAVGDAGLHWQVIPDLGRTSGAVIAFPQGRPATSPGDNVRLDYAVTLARPAASARVLLYLAPTLDVSGAAKSRIAVSIDDGPIQTISDSLVPAPNDATIQAQRDWNAAVEDNVRIVEARFPALGAGKHMLKIWRVDDNVVLQKLVLATGTIPKSYLGPAAGARPK
jgi:hypothetical protein